MPPLPIIADVYRCTFNWVETAKGLLAANVMHFHAVGTTPAGLAAIIDAHVAVGMWQFTVGSASVQTLEVTKLDGTSATYTFPTGSPAKWTGGQGVGDFIPQVAGLVKLNTTLRGRSFRGRVFLPFVAEAAQVSGTLTAGNVTTAQAAWNNFLTAMSVATADLTVASYHLSTDTLVLNALVESQTATQRRRQRR